MKVKLIAGDIRPLTRAMNALGRDASPVFRDVGDAVAKVAAKDIGREAARFSGQSRALMGAVQARRDRVPYVTVNGGTIFRRNGKSRRTAVRAKHLMHAVEFGTRAGNPRHRQITRAHGTDLPQSWSILGHWFYPTVERNVPRYTRMYADAMDRLLDMALGGL